MLDTLNTPGDRAENIRESLQRRILRVEECREGLSVGRRVIPETDRATSGGANPIHQKRI